MSLQSAVLGMTDKDLLHPEALDEDSIVAVIEEPEGIVTTDPTILDLVLREAGLADQTGSALVATI